MDSIDAYQARACVYKGHRMNKEPLGLYIFRFIMGFGLLFFMAMLYWSSTLAEKDLKELRADVLQLKSDLLAMRLDAEKSRSELLQHIIKIGVRCAAQKLEGNSQEEKNSPATTTPIDDEISSNLLKEDPFFDEVLPKLLGDNFQPYGIQQTAVVGKPQNLHPFSNWSQVSAWQGLCGVNLAKLAFGRYETMTPDMALSIEERINSEDGTPEYVVRLRDQAYWQPLPKNSIPHVTLAPQFLQKNQVTADDYKFYYDAMMNPFVQEPGAVALRTFYGAIREFKVIDKLTFIVRWKTELVKDEKGQEVKRVKYIAKQLTGGLRPLPGFVFKYFADGKKIIEDDSDPDTYRTNSVWAQNFATHWAKNVIPSCGPWVFEDMNERQIKFKRNPDFYFSDSALTQGITVDFKDSPENVWQAFKNNQLQSYNLQPDQMADYKRFMASDAYKQQEAQGYAVKRLDYVNRSYSYIAWNEARPYFKSAKVRRALTMGIDRRRIIERNLNGQGIETTGTFYRYSPAYDPSIEPLPFNPQEAKRLLEEEGWYDSDGDGIIDKEIDGKRVPFKFRLTYYVKNQINKSVCEYVATALKEIGIEAHLNGIDIADLSSTFDDKSFDALCMAWALGTPPEDPRQLWHSAGAKEKGSSNAIGFANKEVDSIIDKLEYEYDQKKRIELYHRFDAILHEEQPYTFLYTPKVAMLYRSYLQNVFIPAERQDLAPGANIGEPDSSIFWIKKRE